MVINLTLDPDQVAMVDRMADVKRTSRAAIVREAIDFFFAERTVRSDTVSAVSVNREAA